MRIVYATFIVIAFLLIALLLSVRLFFYSVPLFAVFIGTFPVALCLLWYIRKNRTPLDPSNPSAERDIPEGDRSSEQDKEIRSARKGFWIRVAIIIGSASIWVALVEVNLPLDLSSKYWENVFPFLTLATGILFLYALGSVTGILLLKRSKTHFPEWSILVGIASGMVFVSCFLMPFVLFHLEGPMSHGPPSNSFKINQTILIKLELGASTIIEKYEIEPLDRFTVIDVEEIKKGRIPMTEIQNFQKFESGQWKDKPLMGIRVSLQRPLTVLKTENLGLFRSKFIFSPQSITLLTRDLRLSPEFSYENEPYRLGTSSGEEINSKVEIELPKNSFLASFPKGDTNFLPDKDTVKLSLSEASENIEVYYLAKARFKIVQGFLAESSDYDVIVGILAFVFWPAAGLVVGVFHKALADGILSFGRQLFGSRAPKPIGFVSSNKK